MKFTQINQNTIDGRLLMAALAIITTESRKDETPDQVMEAITKLGTDMFKDHPMKVTGIALIANERNEQIEKHGRTIETDVTENWDAQLSTAAGMLCYEDIDELDGRDAPPTNWDLETWQKMWDKPYFERLKIAGALIAAEIDRLQNQ